MKQALKVIAIMVAITAALASSGVAWYAFSVPPAEHLALARDLIDGKSAQGWQLLALNCVDLVDACGRRVGLGR
jgi:hypothetical protein